jgi:hypothetical protein
MAGTLQAHNLDDDLISLSVVPPGIRGRPRPSIVKSSNRLSPPRGSLLSTRWLPNCGKLSMENSASAL